MPSAPYGNQSIYRDTTIAASTFNPLETAHDLEAAGLERRQAEAIAEGMRRAATADRDELATKADLAGLRADLAGLEGRIYRALWMQGAAIAALILAAKLL